MVIVNRRQVDAKAGEKLAKVNDAAWIETSAKNNVNFGMSFTPNTYSCSRITPNAQYFFFLRRQGFRILLARNRKDDGAQSS